MQASATCRTSFQNRVSTLPLFTSYHLFHSVLLTSCACCTCTVVCTAGTLEYSTFFQQQQLARLSCHDEHRKTLHTDETTRATDFGYVPNTKELPWPSGYELRLSLERSRVLILVKVIGGRQAGHPVQKCSLLQQKSQLTPNGEWRKTTSQTKQQSSGAIPLQKNT